jgi:hypothetical protein
VVAHESQLQRIFIQPLGLRFQHIMHLNAAAAHHASTPHDIHCSVFSLNGFSRSCSNLSCQLSILFQ